MRPLGKNRVIAYLQKISTREWLAAEMGSPLNSTHYSLCIGLQILPPRYWLFPHPLHILTKPHRRLRRHCRPEDREFLLLRRLPLWTLTGVVRVSCVCACACVCVCVCVCVSCVCRVCRVCRVVRTRALLLDVSMVKPLALAHSISVLNDDCRGNGWCRNSAVDTNLK
jgi:hypothetical protein